MFCFFFVFFLFFLRFFFCIFVFFCVRVKICKKKNNKTIKKKNSTFRSLDVFLFLFLAVSLDFCILLSFFFFGHSDMRLSV